MKDQQMEALFNFPRHYSDKFKKWLIVSFWVCGFAWILRLLMLTLLNQEAHQWDKQSRFQGRPGKKIYNI